MRVCAVFGVLLLATSTCFAHSNANGFGYFALEWPSDVTYVADGEDGDWAWYDPNFIITPDEMGEVVQQVIPDKSDIDVSIRTAWTQAPDNRIYGFVRVTDDSLHAAETDPENGWFEDDLEIITDGDHSGGPYRDPNQVNAQQWTMHVQVPGGYSTPYGNGHDLAAQRRPTRPSSGPRPILRPMSASALLALRTDRPMSPSAMSTPCRCGSTWKTTRPLPNAWSCSRE